MRTALAIAIAIALALARPANAGELWAYVKYDPDCSHPAIYISPETKELERPDYVCKITGSEKAKASFVYAANCATDEPAPDTATTVTVTPQTDGTAIIEWRDADNVDSDRYKLCPSSEEPATM